jgi:hypothetical protein
VTQLALKNNFVILTGTEPPVDGETGANIAGPSSLYAFCVNEIGGIYMNVGTRARPAWRALARVEE